MFYNISYNSDYSFIYLKMIEKFKLSKFGKKRISKTNIIYRKFYEETLKKSQKYPGERLLDMLFFSSLMRVSLCVTF